MKNVLITGATGNVGFETIKALSKLHHQLRVFAGVRDLNKDPERFSDYSIHFRAFDFTDGNTYKTALSGCEILFLLRPPQIADVPKFFKPLIEAAKASAVKHILFLSVQGVENNSFIPHHKIEKLVQDSGIAYTFLRPAYFMQNFTTTLRNDLVDKRQIFLPAGNALFTLVDVRDVGAVAAQVMLAPELHVNKAYDLTSHDRLSFKQMTGIISDVTGSNIRYVSPGLVKFFLTKRKEGVPVMFILVMIMLHYLPRFQKEPPLTNHIAEITGRPPVSFTQFITDHADLLI